MYFGNEALLKWVWSNILNSAIKQSPQRSYIHISMSQKENLLLVALETKEMAWVRRFKKHIFEKDYQGGPSRKTEENGLGLALVKRIVELRFCTQRSSAGCCLHRDIAAVRYQLSISNADHFGEEIFPCGDLAIAKNMPPPERMAAKIH